MPGIKGLKDTSFLTNATLYNLTELPASMGVIGAGAIGCEMAQAFARFGSKVTVFLRSKHLLGKEDPEAAALLLAEMRRDGVHFEFGVQYTSVDHQDGDKSKPIVVSFINKDGEASTTPVDQLLVAAGRVPNVEGLGLEKAGVAYDLHKGVIVNDYLQTSNANIYGTGDACSAVSSARFTHVSGTHGGLVWKNACFDAKQKFSGYVVPAVTYTEPEVAHIGAYQDDIDRWTSDPVLKKQKFGAHSVKTISKTLLHNDRAILDGTNTSGLLKVHHLDDADGTIVGATLVCKHAGDMIMELATCMQNGVGVSAIGSTIHPYPTQSEVIASSGWHFNGGKTTDSIKQLLKEHLEQARAADKQ